MTEVYYATSDWVDLEGHAFECEADCVEFSKERIIAKLGKEYVADQEAEEPDWLSWQFDVYSMNFHKEGQY